jgi:hypothetical protein
MLLSPVIYSSILGGKNREWLEVERPPLKASDGIWSRTETNNLMGWLEVAN